MIELWSPTLFASLSVVPFAHAVSPVCGTGGRRRVSTKSNLKVNEKKVKGTEKVDERKVDEVASDSPRLLPTLPGK